MTFPADITALTTVPGSLGTGALLNTDYGTSEVTYVNGHLTSKAGCLCGTSARAGRTNDGTMRAPAKETKQAHVCLKKRISINN